MTAMFKTLSGSLLVVVVIIIIAVVLVVVVVVVVVPVAVLTLKQCVNKMFSLYTSVSVLV